MLASLRRFLIGTKPTLRKVQVVAAAAAVDGMTIVVADLADLNTFDGHTASFYALFAAAIAAYLTPERKDRIRDYLDG